MLFYILETKEARYITQLLYCMQSEKKVSAYL